MPDVPAVRIDSIAENNSGSIGAIKVIVKEAPRRAPKEKYADGTIGRNANQRNYIAYLLGQYYEFKKVDVNFGVDPLEHARIMKGLYPTVNNTIRKLFGAYPNGQPEEKFPALVDYMKEKINKTRLGKKQKKAGHQNYKTFDEFCALGTV